MIQASLAFSEASKNVELSQVLMRTCVLSIARHRRRGGPTLLASARGTLTQHLRSLTGWCQAYGKWRVFTARGQTMRPPTSVFSLFWLVFDVYLDLSLWRIGGHFVQVGSLALGDPSLTLEMAGSAPTNGGKTRSLTGWCQAYGKWRVFTAKISSSGHSQ